MIREEPCPRCLGTGYVYLYPPSSNLISPCDFCKGNKKILRMIEEPPSLSEQVIDLRKRIEALEKPMDLESYITMKELASLWRGRSDGCISRSAWGEGQAYAICARDLEKALRR